MIGILESRRSWLLPLITFVAACASTPAAQPARLASLDEQTLAQVKDILRQSLGKQDIALGPQTLEATTITILPPPLGGYDMRSTATPEILDIALVGRVCVLMRREPKTTLQLQGVSCVASAPALKQ